MSNEDETTITHTRRNNEPGALARAVASATEVMSQPPAKQAVIYLRVSSNAQADKDYNSEGYSLPAQRAACGRKAVGLGAAVVGEFLERGESGKSTLRRGALAAMLARVKEGDIDYVIVHKVDRLARRRSDDVVIAEAIRSSGAQLVSVSENIDETPSGMLLHGIMASIAEFYSLNLAAEVMKGTTEKARRGGTPGRPPIGYLNAREFVDGREIRTIAIDPERGHYITAAFELYATGDYSLSELAAILEERGLRNRARRGYPTVPLGGNRLSAMLRNDYYIGVVRYAGKTSQGRHPKLIDETTFQRVQEILDAQRLSGERCWRHHNYLRGTVYCGECGGRLMYTRAKGKGGGIYEYFVCAGRQDGVCKQPHHRVEAVEQAIEREYSKIELRETRREKIREDIRAYVDKLDGIAEPERQQLAQKLAKLAAQEKKLLQAHYNDHISAELFADEQRRVRTERVAAETRLAQLQVSHGEILDELDTALGLTDKIEAAYAAADPKTRRMFNQAIFERIWIDRETISDRQLATPFAQIVDVESDGRAHNGAAATRHPRRGNDRRAGCIRDDAPASNDETPTGVSFRGGSYLQRMVRAEVSGFMTYVSLDRSLMSRHICLIRRSLRRLSP